MKMISVLINAALGLADLKALLSHIFDTVSDREKVELIFSILDQELLDDMQQCAQAYKKQMRILFKYPGILDNYHDRNEIFNYLYQQTHQDSQLVVLVEDIDTTFEQGWDKRINLLVTQLEQKYGHGIFLINFSNKIFYSADFLDIVGGFGIISDIEAWMGLITEKAKLPLGDPLIFSDRGEVSALASMDKQQLQQKDCFAAIEQITTSLASSVVRHILQSREKQRMQAVLDKMDLIETANHITDIYPCLDVVRILLIRHFSSSPAYVLRHHSIPILNVIICAILQQKEMIATEYIPEDWRQLMSAWCVKGMRKINASPK